MATAVGVDHVLGAPAPAVQLKLDQRRLLLLLGTLTASVTYTAEVSPPDWLWPDNGVLCHAAVCESAVGSQTYLVYFYGNVAAVLVLILLRNPLSINQRINWYVLRVGMDLFLLCLIGAYAGNCLSLMIHICTLAFAAAVLLYIAIQILVFLCKPVESSLSSSVQESPQKCPKLLPSKKKKYLLKVEQKNHQQQNIMSGQDSGDAYQILKKSRMHMLLLATLAASATYQAGLNSRGGFWQDEAQYASGDNRIRHDKRYLVFFCCNTSAFVVSLVIIIILDLSSEFSTQGIKYYCALQVAVTVDILCLIGAYVAVTVDRFCLIGAYVTGSTRQLYTYVHISMLVSWVSIYVAIHLVVFLLQVLLGWAKWPQALKEKMEHCLPDWLKKSFGLSTDGHSEEEEDDAEEEEEEEVAMALKLEQWRKFMLLVAILAAILAYHDSTSPPSDNLVNYRRLAFTYCKATVFIASLSIIAMLANRKLPAARCVRWHAMRACVILDVIGLTGFFAARGYWNISTMDVIILVLAVVLCIAFQVALSISGTPRAQGLVQSLLSMLGSQVIAGPDPLQDDDTQHDFEFGLTGGTNEEPLGVEIASPILGGALTVIVAVPVISVLTIPVKLLVGIMIASIGVGLWRRSLARLLLPLARALQRRQGTTQSTSSSSPPPGHGLYKLIHTLCSETWMWIIILVFWVPSLRHNLKLKLKISRILAVLSVLVDSTPTPTPTTGTAASTTTTATMDTPSTATSTMVGTPITADASGGIPIRADAAGTPIREDAAGTSMGRGVRPLAEPRPRRNRRPNSLLTGPDWVN